MGLVGVQIRSFCLGCLSDAELDRTRTDTSCVHSYEDMRTRLHKLQVRLVASKQTLKAKVTYTGRRHSLKGSKAAKRSTSGQRPDAATWRSGRKDMNFLMCAGSLLMVKALRKICSMRAQSTLIISTKSAGEGGKMKSNCSCQHRQGSI